MPNFGDSMSLRAPHLILRMHIGENSPNMSLRRSAATAAISILRLQEPAIFLGGRQSRAWQSLCCENLRLLRPKGLAMTQERSFCSRERLQRWFLSVIPAKAGIQECQAGKSLVLVWPLNSMCCRKPKLAMSPLRKQGSISKNLDSCFRRNDKCSFRNRN